MTQQANPVSGAAPFSQLSICAPLPALSLTFAIAVALSIPILPASSLLAVVVFVSEAFSVACSDFASFAALVVLFSALSSLADVAVSAALYLVRCVEISHFFLLIILRFYALCFP